MKRGLDYRYNGWVTDDKTAQIEYHSALATTLDGTIAWDTDEPGPLYIHPVITDYDPNYYGWGYEIQGSEFYCAVLWIPQFLYCLADTYRLTLWKDEFVFDFPKISYDSLYHDLITHPSEDGYHYTYRKQVGTDA